MASPSAKKFIAHCNQQAEKMARGLVEAVYEQGRVKQSEREGLIAFCLSDELVHFFFNTLPLYLAEPETEKALARTVAARRGRNSGAIRWNSSLKLRFLRWALAENQRNPELSKNAIAERYARDNPGASAATLRRYLASIPTSGED